MRTKIIPFDLEIAKKIQAGKIKGKIVRRGAQKQVCEILEFAAEYQDKCSEKFLIVKVPAHDIEREKLWIYHQDGRAMHNSNYGYGEMWFDLALEVPDEPQFEPFEKVLVRDTVNEKWFPAFYAYYDKESRYNHIVVGGIEWKHCIPYEGNEHLVNTTGKPKEE